MLVKYLSVSAVVPGGRRASLQRAALAVPGRRRDRLRGGLRARAPRLARTRDRLSRGLPRRRADLAHRRDLRRASRTCSPGSRSSTARSTRSSSRCRASRRPGRSILTNVDSVDHSLLLWRQFTQWLGGMGIIVLALAVLPRLRVGGRQLLDSELAGPETEALSRPDPHHGAAALAPLHRAHGGARGRARRCSASSGSTTGWGCSRASRSRSRRSRPVASRRRSASLDRVRGRHAVGRDRVHGHRRDQLRARLPRARPAPLAQRDLGSGASPLPRHPRRRLDRARRRALDGRARDGRGGDPPRRLPGRLDHDDDGLRERGLLHLGDASA